MLELIFGHLLGDYFFQTHNMAAHKMDPGKSGLIKCMEHCIIYTACIIFAGWNLIPTGYLILTLVGIFGIHYFIDRYGLAYKFIQLKGGPDKTNPFFPIIYCVIDNTSHIVLMVLYLKYIIGINI